MEAARAVVALTVTGPLAWPVMTGYLAARAIPGVEAVSGTSYRRTITVDGTTGVLELAPGANDRLQLHVHLSGRAALGAIADRARHIPNLGLDIEAAERHLVTDPLIGPLVATRPGLRPPGGWDPFELGVRAIVGQQVSVAGATTLIGRIVARHGAPAPELARFGLTHAFPPAERVAVADLDGLGFTGARRRAIGAFAAAVAAGHVRFDGEQEELVASINAVPGLGPWTANYIALRLGHADAFPATDLGLQRALARPDRPSAAALAAMAERWRPWRAVAAAHLWLS